jgi:hypothetical protein
MVSLVSHAKSLTEGTNLMTKYTALAYSLAAYKTIRRTKGTNYETFPGSGPLCVYTRLLFC